MNNHRHAFDAGFGTDKESLEWILFLEAEPAARTARFAELEHFRNSWRRPKWRLAEEKTQ